MVIILLAGYLVSHYVMSLQPSTTVSLNPYISGQATLYNLSLSAVCSLPGMILLFPKLVSGCPYLNTVEYLNQTTPLTLTINKRVLLPRDSVTITSAIGTSSPQIDLVRTVSLFGSSASLDTSVNGQSAPGSGVTQTFEISIFELLGKVTTEILNATATIASADLEHNATLTTYLTQSISLNRSSSAQLVWKSTGFEQNTTLLFKGGSDTISIETRLTDNQTWDSNWFICTSVIILGKKCTPDLYNSISSASFSSDYVNAYKYYEVNIHPQKGGIINNNLTAWYLSGYQLALNATPEEGYAFVGYRYGNGTWISNNTQYTLAVTSPLNITGVFATRPPDYFWDYVKVGVLFVVLLAIFFGLIAYALRSLDRDLEEAEKAHRRQNG
jgi:hypothetical protein